jgi:hypothetical protein
MTKSNVVRQVRLVSNNLLRSVKLDQSLFIAAFLIQQTSYIDEKIKPLVSNVNYFT